MARSLISLALGVLTDNVTFTLLDGESMHLHRILRQLIDQFEFFFSHYYLKCLMDCLMGTPLISLEGGYMKKSL